MSDDRTLFDSTDDDRDVAAGGQEGLASHLPRPCVEHVIASSVESRGGVPCMERDGKSPSQNTYASKAEADTYLHERLHAIQFTCNRCKAEGSPPSCEHFQQPWEVDKIAQAHKVLQDEGLVPRVVGPTDSLWREIPHEQFMAMTELEQLDYCARRDEDSARFADSDEDAKWYLWRAGLYRRRIAELRQSST